MKSRLMAWHAPIFNYFVQSNKLTTPIGVNHPQKTVVQEARGMFAEHVWSTFLRLKGV